MQTPKTSSFERKERLDILHWFEVGRVSQAMAFSLEHLANFADQVVEKSKSLADNLNERLSGGILGQATAATDEPTPGYLFGEISKMTHESSEQCDKVTDYLTTHLRSKDPNVKWKVLVIIKHVSRMGSVRFQRHLQMHTQEIKSCLHFKGRPHPTKGDAPFRKVRTAAKAALDAIFKEKRSPRDKGGRMRGKHMDGFGGGHSGWSESGFKGAGSSSTGFSNGDNVGRYEPRSFGKKNKSNGNNSSEIPGLGGPPPKGWSYATNRGSNSVSKSGTYSLENADSSDDEVDNSGEDGHHREESVGKKKKKRDTGRVRGGKWAARKSDYVPGELTGGDFGGGHSSSQTTKQKTKRKKNVGGKSTALTGSAISDGSFEQSVVDKVIYRGGMKVEPSHIELEEVCAKCRSLNVDVVAPMIEEKLDEDHWQLRGKALAVILALLRTKGCEEYSNYFRENNEAILDQTEALKPKVRALAKKVMKELKGKSISTTSEKQKKKKRRGRRNPATRNAKKEVDLLDLGGGGGGGGDKEEEGETVSLFGGMSLGEEVESTNNTSEMFGGMDMNVNVDNTGGEIEMESGMDDLLGGDMGDLFVGNTTTNTSTSIDDMPTSTKASTIDEMMMSMANPMGISASMNLTKTPPKAPPKKVSAGVAMSMKPMNNGMMGQSGSAISQAFHPGLMAAPKSAWQQRQMMAQRQTQMGNRAGMMPMTMGQQRQQQRQQNLNQSNKKDPFGNLNLGF
eukprot:g2460.t1